MTSAAAITPPIRVLCVDDLEDMTEALRLTIGTDSSMVCVGCLSSADDLLREVKQFDPPPDVLILDATMPGKGPLAAMKELADACPTTRTIIYSGFDDVEFIDQALQVGAWRCVSKRDEPAAVLRAVREVAAERARGARPSPGL